MVQYSMSFAALISLFACFSLAHAEYLDPEKEAKIDAIVNSLSICGSWAGMSISIVRNGETVFAKGYGVKDMEENDPVTPDTLFGIASVTKQFNAALLGLVLKENGYNWDTKVRDVLGKDFFAYDGLRTSHLTMKDLATHRTGHFSKDSIGWKPDITRKEIAQNIWFIEPEDSFRNRAIYNNNNFEIMAYIAEFLAGKTWENLMTERFFEPLNMTKTTFMGQIDLSRDDLAKPYGKLGFFGPLHRVADKVIRAQTITAGPGGIATTGEDFAKWMIMQLNKGHFNGETIIPEDQILEARIGYTPMPFGQNLWTRPTIPVDYYTPVYGLGFYVGSYRGYNILNHAGVYTGYTSRVTLLQDLDIGIFSVLSGVDLTTFGHVLLHAFIMDLMLDVEPWLNTVNICTFPLPWIELLEIPLFDPERMTFQYKKLTPRLATSLKTVKKLDLSAYTGQFGEFFYGNLTVFINQTSEQLMLQYGLMSPFTLEPTEVENVFYGRPELVYYFDLREVIFSRSDESLENFDHVVVPFDPPVPSTFIRELKMSDAPPPPDPNNCR